jgi:hypothetical protein
VLEKCLTVSALSEMQRGDFLPMIESFCSINLIRQRLATLWLMTGLQTSYARLR